MPFASCSLTVVTLNFTEFAVTMLAETAVTSCLITAFGTPRDKAALGAPLTPWRGDIQIHSAASAAALRDLDSTVLRNMLGAVTHVLDTFCYVG